MRATLFGAKFLYSYCVVTDEDSVGALHADPGLRAFGDIIIEAIVIVDGEPSESEFGGVGPDVARDAA